MLKAALEALRKNEQSTQAIKQTQKAPPLQIGAKLDSDEDELMDLLDEIGHIELPTIMPTQKPPIQMQNNKVTESPSSDLLDGIDENDMVIPPIQTTIPIRPLGPSTLQATIPVRTIEAGTLLSRSRPAIGESPSAIAPVVPQIASTLETLPYPINPDGFTPELFTQNLTALLPLLSVTSQGVPLSSISSIDRLSKVPLVIGMVTAMDHATGRDYLVTISDDSGSIAVTVHEQVPRETILEVTVSDRCTTKCQISY